MKRNLLACGLFSIFFSAFSPCLGEKTALTSGLTFYAGFEKSLAADNCAGARSFAGSYSAAPGKVGNGFLSKPSQASYPCAANLTRKKGTLSFWVKLAVEIGSLKKDYALFSTTDPDSMKLVYVQVHHVIFDLTACSPPGKDWTWDWSLHVPVESIPKDCWTHVVLTWDKRLPETVEGVTLEGGETRKTQKKIYINGKLAGSGEVPGIDGADEGSFTLGGGIPGVYDELMVWDRVLTSSEIEALYNKPEATAKEVKALPPLTRVKEWLVYPELVYRNYIDSLIAPGEKFAIDVPLVNRTDKVQAGKLSLRLLDMWERPCGQPRIIDFKMNPKTSAKFPAVFVPDKFGIFKIEAAIDINGRKDFRDITSFACIPAGNPPFHPFFGGHTNCETNMPEMARRLGFASHRVHDMTQYTWWSRMEPARGKFMMLQEYLNDTISKLKFHQLGQWYGAPYWAVTLSNGKNPDPPKDLENLNVYPPGWMPTDMKAYENYVRESIKRFPVIKEWEIWNEPYCSYFFTGSVEDYVNLCKVSYETAKSINPSLTIYAMFDDGFWGKAIMKNGAWKYCDGLSYHDYCVPGRWDAELQRIKNYREFVKKNTGKDMPLINSEGGISGTTFLRGLDFPELPPEYKREPMSFRPAAERIIQYYITSMAEGVRQWYYYYHQPVGESNSYSSWSTVEITRTPKPFVVALCMLTWQLDGGTFAAARELKGPLYAYLFDRKDGDSVAVLWTVDEGEVDLKHPGRFFDLMGNEIQNPGVMRITPTPVYLQFKGKAAQLAKTLDDAAVTIVKNPVKKKEVKSEIIPPKKMKDYAVARELGETRLIPLDLRPIVNMGLADERAADGKGGWTDEGPFNDMRDLTPGRHKWLGVPFLIIDPAENKGKSVLTLKGMTLLAGPEKSPPIPVDRKVRGFFFAQAANYCQNPGATAGAYKILYGDGKVETVPLVMGMNIYDWWWDCLENEDSRTIPIPAKESIGGAGHNRFLRIWYWENTRRNVPVKSITLTTQPGSPAALILLGITAAVWDK